MQDADFQALVDGFVRLERDVLDQPLNGSDAIRPGRWLVEILGMSLTSVGLAYEDGFWAERFLNRLDTRSSDEMTEWDGRVSRAWARRNAKPLPDGVRAKWLSRAKLYSQTRAADWGLIAGSIDWTSIGPWGPGQPGSSYRLRRAQALFILTRLVSAESGREAAFSFMIGNNQELDGYSPLTFVSAFSVRPFEETLLAADRYLGGQP